MKRPYHSVAKAERFRFCVLGWRTSEKDSCPIEDDCRYWSKVQHKCTYLERGERDRQALAEKVK